MPPVPLPAAPPAAVKKHRETTKVGVGPDSDEPVPQVPTRREKTTIPGAPISEAEVDEEPTED